MYRQTVNRICAAAPVILSLVAFGVLMAALTAGWEKGDTDEGSVAHIFQLLIVSEVPFVFAYFATADWERAGRFGVQVGLQAVALGLALAPVAIFRL